MVEVDGAFRTDDMTLAAVLVSQGYRCTIERLNSRHAVWVFKDDSEEFGDLVEAYEEGSVKVEPKSFMIEFSRVRSELYEFLGHRAQRRPRSAPATT